MQSFFPVDGEPAAPDSCNVKQRPFADDLYAAGDAALCSVREQALADEGRRLAAIIKGMQIGTWELNVSVDSVRVNDAWTRLLGGTPCDATTVPLLELLDRFHPNDHLVCSKSFARILTGQAEIMQVSDVATLKRIPVEA
ncbi:hypothetical protein [Pseudomonas sp. NA-150]|uniref:hypothetical protein n=1 Tax=Pseudomonas sp. NA-150 TaxID=3367525 RepID=UPI0037CB3133